VREEPEFTDKARPRPSEELAYVPMHSRASQDMRPGHLSKNAQLLTACVQVVYETG